jgi:phosphopantothenoylcysteine decarboxylase/phosphopantothenate--cysteine ligase
MSKFKKISKNSDSSKKILLKMSGSIAAYKVCHIISKLVQAGHEVQVVSSPHVHHFIGSSTLEGLSQKPVISDTFEPHNAMAHIHLMRWADIILAAPATANFINKIAAGIGDDLLTTLFLAHDFKKPYLVAPAMNSSMYHHPITQESITKLKNLSIQILESDSGILACGEVGQGRILEPEAILKKLEAEMFPTSEKKKKSSIETEKVKNYKNNTKHMNLSSPSGKLLRILITAGGTQEPIDAMRVLTNLSTGKTAIRMAEYFYSLGYDVTVLAAISSPKPKFLEIKVYKFQSFLDLEEKLKTLVSTMEFDVVVHAAAVSDFSVSQLTQNNTELFHSSDSKISSKNELIIKLKPNPKILPQIKGWSINKNLLVVGFKFTSTENLDERKLAVEKLFADNSVDFVVHNDSFNIDRNKKIHQLSLYDKERNSTFCPSPLNLYQTLSLNLFNQLHKNMEEL